MEVAGILEEVVEVLIQQNAQLRKYNKNQTSNLPVLPKLPKLPKI